MSLTLTAALFVRWTVLSAHETSRTTASLWDEDLRCDKVIAKCLHRDIIGSLSLYSTVKKVNDRSPDSD